MRLTEEQQKLVENNLQWAVRSVRKHCWGKEWRKYLQELHSEALVGLCKAAATWDRGDGPEFHKWASTTCRNHLNDVMKYYRYRFNQLPDHKLARESTNVKAFRKFTRAERNSKLATAYIEEVKQQVPVWQWEVIELIGRGLSHEEVGRTLGITEAAVCSRLVSARRRLGVYDAD